MLTYAGWEAKEAGAEGVKLEELARNVEVRNVLALLVQKYKCRGTQCTCFTSTEDQILTLEKPLETYASAYVSMLTDADVCYCRSDS
jgi:hypothetical protein